MQVNEFYADEVLGFKKPHQKTPNKQTNLPQKTEGFMTGEGNSERKYQRA